jgi:2-isopropylmalate synthase
MSVAEGNGPVNALDMALRKDLGKYQSEIKDLELVDYKVRILNGGTGRDHARADRKPRWRAGERWFTIGVSPNIVDASFQALIDSIRSSASWSGLIDSSRTHEQMAVLCRC